MIAKSDWSNGVLIAHPNSQHSHQFAAALAKTDRLAAYISMLPWRHVSAGAGLIPEATRRALRERLQGCELPIKKVHSWPFVWALAKVIDAVTGGRVRSHIHYIAYVIFDLRVAAYTMVKRPKIIVGYEVSCYYTFIVGKRTGALCILDAASLHRKSQAAYLKGNARRSLTMLGKLIDARKDAEVALADRIVCCSEFAATSYRREGVEGQKIVVNPLGCDTERFTASPSDRSGVFKFGFVGVASETKGFADLLTAFSQLLARGHAAELHLVGDRNAAARYQADAVRGVILHGKLSHGQLAVVLTKIDCVVLPSLMDSFGMVVPEAMASGCYMIVSDRVGSGSLVKGEIDGLVVKAEDVIGLGRAMIDVVGRVNEIRGSQEARRNAAMSYSWMRYRERANCIIDQMGIERNGLQGRPLDNA